MTKFVHPLYYLLLVLQKKFIRC